MIRYYLREYEKRQPVTDPYATYLSETIKIWYPLDYVETPVARINNIPVDRNFVIIDSKSNDETGSLWGIPERCQPCLGPGLTPSTSRTARRC